MDVLASYTFDIHDKLLSYYMEVNEAEAREIFREYKNIKYMGEKPIDKVSENYREPNGMEDIRGFLVTPDLKEISLMDLLYVYSSQWNGYSPFKFFRKITINSLSDLKNKLQESHLE